MQLHLPSWTNTPWTNKRSRLESRSRKQRSKLRRRGARSTVIEALEPRHYMAALVSNFRLVNDTGASNTDRLTSDPRVTGTLGGTWSGSSAGVEFDHNGDGVKEGNITSYMPQSDFTYNPETTQPSLATYNGALNFKYRVVEYNTMNQVIYTGSWVSFAMTLEHPQLPEIQVTDSWMANIPDNVGSFSFGATPLGTSVDKTFTIKNTGPAALTVNTASFSLPSGFTLVTPPASTIAANTGTSSFTVRMSGAVAGVYSGSLSFTNDDSDENPFNFSISGEVVNNQPEIEVRGPTGAVIADGGSFSFGTVIKNQAVDVTFTIHNSGNSALNLSNLQVPTGVTIVSTFASSVTPQGGQTSFTIRLKVSTLGAFSGALSFANNDSNENPYDIQLSATVINSGGAAVSISDVGLVRDSGLSLTDKQTSDPRITGLVGGDFQGGYVEVEVDHNNNGVAEGKATVAASGQTFTYDPRQFQSSLIGHTGGVTLKHRAVLRNTSGGVVSTSAWTAFTFTMIAGPGAGGLDISEIELSKDTGANQTDRVTINPAVYFVIGGTLSTGSARVEFDNNGDLVVDGSVAVAQTGVEYDYDPRTVTPSLASHLGALTLNYRLVKLNASGAVTATGGWDSFRSTIDAPPASLMTVGEWALANDTGASSTDKITTDATVKGKALGTVTQSATALQVAPQIEFDLNNDQTADAWVSTNSAAEKLFTFLPDLAAYGAKTIAARVKEFSDLYGVYLFGAWSTFDFTYTAPEAPAVIELALTNDTGTSATDKITRDPTLGGRLDGADVSQLKIHLDLDNDGDVDATTFADEGGNFSYLPRGLAAGANTIQVKSSRYDPKAGADVFGPWAAFTFTFEAAPVPTVSEFKLFADTGASSTDNKTSNPTLTGGLSLAGESDPVALINVGLEFDHNADGTPDGYASSDGLGHFAYRPMGLGVGVQSLRARAYQYDENLQAIVRGDWTTFGFEIEAALHVSASISGLRLYRDTGASTTDLISTDATIVGSVATDVAALEPAAYMTIQVDTNGDGAAESTVQTDANGAFRYLPLNQAPGTYTVRFRTKDWNYVSRLGTFGAWTSLTYTLVAAVNNPPVLTNLSLLGDTGASATDLHTANPMLTGSVQNEQNAFVHKRVVVEFDHDGDSVGDGLAFTNENGVFYYTPEAIAFGSRTIKARPIEWDETSGSYLIGSWVSTTFTYEDQVNAPPVLVSLGLPLGAGTATSDPTLAGRIINEFSLDDVTIEFDFNNDAAPDQFATTDAYGSFSYTATGLAFGAVQVQARTRELNTQTGDLLYSGWSSFSFTYNQPTNAPASINVFGLKNDTGASNTDGQTTDSTLTGHVDNDGSSAELVVQFDHNNDGVIDGQTTTNADGNFTYRPADLAFAAHTIRARVQEVDQQGAQVFSAWASAAFTLQDPQAFVLRVDSLSLASDTGASATDRSTANANLSGHVANAGGQTRTVEFDVNGDGLVDGTAVTDSSGNFAFSPQTTLVEGYTTARARVASSGTTTSSTSSATNSGWTTLNFVFHSQPDGAEAQAIVAAFNGYNASSQAASDLYQAGYVAAQQAYRAAVQAAQNAYHASIASAWSAQASTTSDAIANYNAIVASANATYVAAIAAARTQFASNLASFSGDKTSYQWKDFAWPEAPLELTAIIPPDGEQPLPPMDGPNYEGGSYLFDLDPSLDADKAAAHQAFLTAVKNAAATFEAARKLIDETLAADRLIAGNEYNADLAAADAVYKQALLAGVNPIDMAVESRLHEQRRDAAKDRYDRAIERLTLESIARHQAFAVALSSALAAADASFETQRAAVWTNSTYVAYYNQYFVWPAQLYQDIKNLEESRDQQKALARKNDTIARTDYTQGDALGLVPGIAQRTALAKLAMETAINASQKTLDEKQAAHDHWNAIREIDAGLVKDQAYAAAGKKLEIAYAEASRKRTASLAVKAKEHDVAVEAANGDRIIADAQAVQDAIDARAAFEQSDWWDYQKAISDNAVAYVVALTPKVVEKFTTNAETARDEITAVAAREKQLIDEAAELRRARRADDAVSWKTNRLAANDHQQTAANADAEKWRVYSDARATADKDFAYSSAANQRTAAVDGAEITRVYEYAVATANAHNSGTANLAHQMAVAAFNRDMATAPIVRTQSYGEIAAKDARDEAKTLATKTYETDAHEIERKQLADDFDSYKTYFDGVAAHAATFRTSFATSYLNYLADVSIKQKESAHEDSEAAKTLADHQAQLEQARQLADAGERGSFFTGAAGDYTSAIDAWDAALNTPWSGYVAADAHAEQARANRESVFHQNFIGQTGTAVAGHLATLSAIEKELSDGVADALDEDNQTVADALDQYSGDSTGARAGFASTVAEKITSHDKNVVARNAALRDATSARQKTRDDAVAEGQWVAERTGADLLRDQSLTLAQIAYDEATGAIAAAAATAARTAAGNVVTAGNLAAEVVRKQAVAAAESTRINGEAADYASWVYDVGQLDLQFANDAKTASDSLVGSLKTAADTLSQSEANAGEALDADVAGANADAANDRAGSAAGLANSLAGVNGADAIAQVASDNAIREDLVHNRGAYETEVRDIHSGKMQAASAPAGPMSSFHDYQKSIAQSDAAWSQGEMNDFDSYQNALSAAYIQEATSTGGPGGANPGLAAALGGINVGATAAQGAADVAFSAGLSGGASDLMTAEDAAQTQSLKSTAIAETTYDIAWVAAQIEFDNAVAAAEVVKTSKSVANQVATYLGNALPFDEAAIAAEYSAAVKAAQAVFADKVGVAQGTRAGTVGDALVTADQQRNDAQIGALTSVAAADAAYESAVTANAVDYALDSGTATNGHEALLAQIRKALVVAMGAANVALEQDRGVTSVARAIGFATAEATYSTAVKVKVAADYATLAASQNTPRTAYLAARAAGDATWQTLLAPAHIAAAAGATQALADLKVGLVAAQNAQNLLLEDANIAYVSARQSLYLAADVARVIAERQWIEAVADADRELALDEAIAELTHDLTIAGAIRTQGIAYASALKTYHVGVYNLPSGESDTALKAARDLSTANADLARETTSADAAVSWTTSVAADTNAWEKALADIDRTYILALANIDRNLLVSLATPNETLTIAAANADVAYDSAVAVADADYRTAKYVVLAGHEVGDLTARAAGVVGMAAAVPLPWLQFRAAVATAHRDWFVASGQSLLFAMGAAINTANATYQTAENTHYVGYYTSLAAAEKTFAIALANARYAEIASAAGAERTYAFAYADNGQVWQIATGVAQRADRVGRETAARDYVSSGDANARDAALASVAATLTAANKDAAHVFTVADTAADGENRIAQAGALRTRANTATDANQIYETAFAAATRVYSVGIATAVAERNIAVHDAIAAYEVARDTGRAAVVAAIAGPGSSPWLIHEAALLDAIGDRSATVVPARADLLEVLELAGRDFIIAAAQAEETHSIALVAAESFRDDAIAELAYERAVDEVSADAALSQTQSYMTYEEFEAGRGRETGKPTSAGRGGAHHTTPKSLERPNQATTKVNADGADFAAETRVTQGEKILKVSTDASAASKKASSEGLDAIKLHGDYTPTEAEIELGLRAVAAWKKLQGKWTGDPKSLLADYYAGLLEGFLDGIKDTLSLAATGFTVAKYGFFKLTPAGMLIRWGGRAAGYDIIGEEDKAVKEFVEKLKGYANAAMTEGSNLWEDREQIALDFGLKLIAITNRLATLREEIKAFLTTYGPAMIQALIDGDMKTVAMLKHKLPPELQQAWDLVTNVAVTLLEVAADNLDAKHLGYLAGQMLYEIAEDAVIGAAWAAVTAGTAGAGGVSGAPLFLARVGNITRKLYKYQDKTGLTTGGIEKIKSVIWWTLRKADVDDVTETLRKAKGISELTDDALKARIKSELRKVAPTKKMLGNSKVGLQINEAALDAEAERILKELRPPSRTLGKFKNTDEAIAFLKTKCFSRDTLVSTKTGLKPIGEIAVGEQVHSFDFGSGEWTLRTVTDRIDSEYEGPVVTIEAGASRIEATIHHPFWVLEGHELDYRPTPRELSATEDQGESLTGRWVNSHDLLAGDVIFSRDGGRTSIERISQRFESSFPVSNLTIGDFHNYSVGFDSVLVHNESICAGGRAALQDMLDEGVATYDEIEGMIRAGGFTDADEVLAEIAENSVIFHRHHAWPKYLGGPTKQDLVRLPKHVHDEYHKGLDVILDRRWTKEYFDGLSPSARRRLENRLAAYTKEFDARHNTKLWEAMLHNGFPGE